MWTGEHCCGDEIRWDGMNCVETSPQDLCFSFWPSNKEEGKGAKYTEIPKKVCWNVGSVAYGFWVPVNSY